MLLVFWRAADLLTDQAVLPAVECNWAHNDVIAEPKCSEKSNLPYDLLALSAEADRIIESTVAQQDALLGWRRCQKGTSRLDALVQNTSLNSVGNYLRPTVWRLRWSSRTVNGTEVLSLAA